MMSYWDMLNIFQQVPKYISLPLKGYSYTFRDVFLYVRNLLKGGWERGMDRLRTYRWVVRNTVLGIWERIDGYFATHLNV